MAEFLKAFIPTFAFMLVPLLIPVLAIAVGSLSDMLRGENRVESVEDRVRAHVAKRDSAVPELALDAA